MTRYYTDDDTNPDERVVRPEPVIRTERGWAAHFIDSRSCGFRRNTLLEYGEKRIIVSTIGNCCKSLNGGDCVQIGLDRYYETMAFIAVWEEPYWEIDVMKPVRFISPWKINMCERETDLEANRMHDNVVEELTNRLIYNDPYLVPTDKK